MNEFPYKVPDGPWLEEWLRFAEGHRVKDFHFALNTSLQAMYILLYTVVLVGLIRLQVSRCCFSLIIGCDYH